MGLGDKGREYASTSTHIILGNLWFHIGLDTEVGSISSRR